MISRPVNVGDEVKEGQLVARIDPRDYEVRLRTAQGQLVNAIAVRKRAQADLDRLLGGLGDSVVSDTLKLICVCHLKCLYRANNFFYRRFFLTS